MNVDYSAFEGWPIEGRPSAVAVRGRWLNVLGVDHSAGESA